MTMYTVSLINEYGEIKGMTIKNLLFWVYISMLQAKLGKMTQELNQQNWQRAASGELLCSIEFFVWAPMPLVSPHQAEAPSFPLRLII